MIDDDTPFQRCCRLTSPERRQSRTHAEGYCTGKAGANLNSESQDDEQRPKQPATAIAKHTPDPETSTTQGSLCDLWKTDPCVKLVITAGTHLHILHHNIDVGGGLNHFVEPDDVGVHEETQDLDFSTHCGTGQERAFTFHSPHMHPSGTKPARARVSCKRCKGHAGKARAGEAGAGVNAETISDCLGLLHEGERS